MFRLLRWEANPIAQNVGGYKRSSGQSNYPIFVTHKKDEQIAATMQYKDRFLCSDRMQWYSKSRRTLESPDVEYFRQLESGQPIRLQVTPSCTSSEIQLVGDTELELCPNYPINTQISKKATCHASWVIPLEKICRARFASLADPWVLRQ